MRQGKDRDVETVHNNSVVKSRVRPKDERQNPQVKGELARKTANGESQEPMYVPFACAVDTRCTTKPRARSGGVKIPAAPSASLRRLSVFGLYLRGPRASGTDRGATYVQRKAKRARRPIDPRAETERGRVQTNLPRLAVTRRRDGVKGGVCVWKRRRK